jgi:DNA-binding NarL/FixJ family response regulator
MVQKKSIVIVDDHTLFREGIKTIIERDHRFEIVGEAGNMRDGLNIAVKLKPDMFLVDISLPDKSGIQLAKEIHRMLPLAPIMIVSMHSKIEYIAEAFQAGALGYVVKESASDRLLHGLNIISRGDYYLDTSVSPGVIKSLMSHKVKKANMTDDSYATLTKREQEIMRLLAEGFTNKDIAEKLFISVKTVENHRGSIMTKLDLHSTYELMRYATKLGLIDVDLWKN